MNSQSESWPRPHRLTVAEYYRMAEVGLLQPDARVELIEGEIIDMPPIGSRHAACVDRLAKRFIEAVGDRAIVRVQGPVRLGVRSEPQPDLALLRPRPDGYADSHPTAADVLLLVEVGDKTLRYDREVKAKLYARHGIPELWVLDIEHGVLHVLRGPAESAYTKKSTVERPGVVQIPELGISIDLTSAF